MADFNKSIGILLNNEGWYVNDPDDPGGATKYGISLRYLKTLGDYGDFDGDGDVDADDIKLLTPAKSSEIYKRFWWDQFKYGLISNQEVATKLFDFSINMGSVRAHKLIQEAANLLYNPIPHMKEYLKVDGILGEKTIRAINKAKPENLMLNFIGTASQFYVGLAQGNRSFEEYISGWMNRAIKRYK